MDLKTCCRISQLALVASLGMGIAACGIPEEKHNALLKDLERCKTELADTQNTLETTEAERGALKDNLSALGGEKDALAKRLGATKKELEELRRARELAQKRLATFKELTRRLSSMISAGKLKVEVRKGRMIVKMNDKILFDPGKTELKEDGQAALAELAQVLKDIDNRDFLVAGHTDNVPIRTRRFRSNWELSAARAVEVVKFMEENGVDPNNLAAAGFSEYDPVADNDTDQGKSLNRRIEIVLMPNIEELPQYDKKLYSE